MENPQFTWVDFIMVIIEIIYPPTPCFKIRVCETFSYANFTKHTLIYCLVV